MTAALRLASRCLLLALPYSLACDDDCDAQCYYVYEDCIDDAAKDSELKARCDAELDQCRGICAAQPMNFDDTR